MKAKAKALANKAKEKVDVEGAKFHFSYVHTHGL